MILAQSYDLTTIQIAAAKYLRDEMASVLVHGEFDPLTQRTFRKLQSNQSVFTERSITNLERAVAVTAAVGRGDNTR